MKTRTKVIAVPVVLFFLYMAFPGWLTITKVVEVAALRKMAATITVDPVEIRNLYDHDPWHQALWPNRQERPFLSSTYRWLDNLPQYYWHARVVGLLLNDSRTTDKSLEYVGSMPYLRYIQLREAQVTDEGIRRVSQHANIVSVELDHTPVTDQALAYLKRMPSLRHLSLQQTRVTAVAVTNFHLARPEVELQSDFGRWSDGTCTW